MQIGCLRSIRRCRSRYRVLVLRLYTVEIAEEKSLLCLRDFDFARVKVTHFGPV